MKKVLILLALSLLAVAGCKKDVKYTNVVETIWHHSPSDPGKVPYDLWLKFADDGTVVYTREGNNYPGTYTVDKNIVTFYGVVQEFGDSYQSKVTLKEGTVKDDKMEVLFLSSSTHSTGAYKVEFTLEQQ